MCNCNPSFLSTLIQDHAWTWTPPAALPAPAPRPDPVVEEGLVNGLYHAFDLETFNTFCKHTMGWKDLGSTYQGLRSLVTAAVTRAISQGVYLDFIIKAHQASDDNATFLCAFMKEQGIPVPSAPAPAPEAPAEDAEAHKQDLLDLQDALTRGFKTAFHFRAFERNVMGWTDLPMDRPYRALDTHTEEAVARADKEGVLEKLACEGRRHGNDATNKLDKFLAHMSWTVPAEAPPSTCPSPVFIGDEAYVQRCNALYAAFKGDAANPDDPAHFLMWASGTAFAQDVSQRRNQDLATCIVNTTGVLAARQQLVPFFEAAWRAHDTLALAQALCALQALPENKSVQVREAARRTQALTTACLVYMAPAIAAAYPDKQAFQALLFQEMGFRFNASDASLEFYVAEAINSALGTGSIKRLARSLWFNAPATPAKSELARMCVQLNNDLLPSAAPPFPSC